MFCTRCGAENKDTSKFCIKCGNKLRQINLQAEPTTGAQPQATNVPAPPVTPPAPPAPVRQSQKPDSPATAQPVATAAPAPVTRSQQTNGSATAQATTTAAALSSNIAGAICYFAGWLSGIVFLILGKGDRFVLFHAWQSIITFGIMTLAAILLNFIPAVPANSVQFWLIYLLQLVIALLIVFLWIFLMIQAYLRHTYKLPLAGALAQKLADGASNK